MRSPGVPYAELEAMTLDRSADRNRQSPSISSRPCIGSGIGQCATAVSLALLMVDADHFKAFNDRYGHPCGDACLKTDRLPFSPALYPAAQAISRPAMAARNSWWCCRKRRAITAALRGQPHDGGAGGCPHPPCRQPAGHRHHQHRRHGDCPGASAATQPNTLVAAADAALYLAKQQGRDRLVVSEPEREDRDIMAA